MITAWGRMTRGTGKLLLGGLLLGCDEGADFPSAPSDPTGVYVLQSINGQRLPFNLGYGLPVASAALTLEKDLDYTINSASDEQATEFTLRGLGSYEYDGTRILFFDDLAYYAGYEAPHYVGTFGGGGRTLTIVMGSGSWAFRK